MVKEIKNINAPCENVSSPYGLDSKPFSMGVLYLLIMSTESGIYKIQSKTFPERFYIGSSSNMNGRWSAHKNRLKLRLHHSGYLQNHFNKYGLGDLVFSVIEKCSIDNLITREQFYVDSLNPPFNMCKEAGSTRGIKLPPCFGEKTRKRFKGIPFTQDHKDKLSKKVYQFTLDGILVREFNSTRETDNYGFDHSRVSACCLGKSTNHLGFIWSYAKDKMPQSDLKLKVRRRMKYNEEK